MVNAKCKLKEDGFFEWCTAMEKMLYPEANAQVKGLVQVNLFNFTTGKESCLGVAYRDSHLKKCNKIVLNKCPWCGEDIFNHSKIKKVEVTPNSSHD